MIKFSTMIAGYFSALVVIIPLNSYIFQNIFLIIVTHILTDSLLLTLGLYKEHSIFLRLGY